MTDSIREILAQRAAAGDAANRVAQDRYFFASPSLHPEIRAMFQAQAVATSQAADRAEATLALYDDLAASDPAGSRQNSDDLTDLVSRALARVDGSPALLAYALYGDSTRRVVLARGKGDREAIDEVAASLRSHDRCFAVIDGAEIWYDQTSIAADRDLVEALV